MRGWIYVFTNKAMPGLVKIGYTDRDPLVRVSEQHSGLPYPHELQYEVLVDNAYSKEQLIHKRLFQYNESKEWFRLSPEEAISKIKLIIGQNAHIENYVLANKNEAERLKAEAEALRRAEAQQRQLKLDNDKKFETRRSEIYSHYNKQLNLLTDPPNDDELSLTIVKIVIFGSIGYAFYDDGMFIWFIVIFMVFSYFYNTHKNKEKARIKNSPKYKNLLKERDRKIEELKFEIYGKDS